jgi:hypothetical protein
MSKSIAERFADEIGSTPKTDSVSELYSMVLTWLIKQPENDAFSFATKTLLNVMTTPIDSEEPYVGAMQGSLPLEDQPMFSITQVEAILRQHAREQSDYDLCPEWWTAKKAELLGKV